MQALSAVVAVASTCWLGMNLDKAESLLSSERQTIGVQIQGPAIFSHHWQDILDGQQPCCA